MCAILPYILYEKIGSQADTFARSNSYMNRAFIPGTTREFFENFHFMTILVMPQVLESWQLCHNMLCGRQMSYSDKVWGFGVFEQI